MERPELVCAGTYTRLAKNYEFVNKTAPSCLIRKLKNRIIIVLFCSARLAFRKRRRCFGDGDEAQAVIAGFGDLSKTECDDAA